MTNFLIVLCVFLWLVEIICQDLWLEEYTQPAPREIISEPAEPQIPPEPMGLAPLPPQKP